MSRSSTSKVRSIRREGLVHVDFDVGARLGGIGRLLMIAAGKTEGVPRYI
jgi:hypothetical protein